MTYNELKTRFKELLSRRGRGSIKAKDILTLILDLIDKIMGIDVSATATIRKSYNSLAEANADKTLIDPETNKPLKIGQLISVVSDPDISNNAIFRLSSIAADGTPTWERQAPLGDMTQYAKSGGSSMTMSELEAHLRFNISNNLFNGKLEQSQPWDGYISCWHTDFIQVIPETTYTVSGVDFGTLKYRAIGYFDISKSYISHVGIYTNKVATVKTPPNAVYMLVVLDAGGYPADTSWLQIEKGPTATSYKPHKVLSGYLMQSDLMDYVKTDVGENLFSGVIVKSQPWSGYISLWNSGAIKISPLTTYVISGINIVNLKYKTVGYLSASGTLVSTSQMVSNISGDIVLNAPSSAEYIVINLEDTNGVPIDISKLQLEEGNVSTFYKPHKYLTQYVLKSEIADVPEMLNLQKKFSTDYFAGKHAYYLGDSITNSGRWTNVVHELLRFGNSNARNGNLGKDGCQWTDTIIDGISTENNVKNRIDALEAELHITNIEPSILIFALGTNDWGNSKPIGSRVETISKTYEAVGGRATVYDAIKYAITRTRKLCPNAFIAIMTPIQRKGRYDVDYINAITDAAHMMSVPVYDCYSESGLIAFDEWLEKYYTDGLHITVEGGQLYGKYVANKIVESYCNYWTT